LVQQGQRVVVEDDFEILGKEGLRPNPLHHFQSTRRT